MNKQDKNKILRKINKQIESLQKKTSSLTGDYLCNTYKRMREQNNRDKKINGYRFEIDILTYLLDCSYTRELTAVEIGLLDSQMRASMNAYLAQNKSTSSQSPRVKYPEFNDTDSDWWKIEATNIQKCLKKANIFNTQQLLKAVEEYSTIVDTASKPVDQTQMKIKKLERECIMMQKGDINFTPPEVAKYMVELARIDSDSIVLEPSAGIARIADEIKAVTLNVDVVEQMPIFKELLTLKGHNLVCDDFMQYAPVKLYDAVIANPPFSEEEAHIKHMYNLLKPGGTLVTICSPHWTFARDKKAVEFKSWIEEMDGYTQDLPSGTFEMTGVASKILVIEKKAS